MGAPDPSRHRPARYDGVAIALHWLTALFVIGLAGVGFWMTDLKPSPTKIEVHNWHKWFGLTVLALTAVRLAWRATHRPPPLLVASRAKRALAHAVHGLLYLLLLAMPLTGWLMNSAAGFPLTWFGLFRVPPLIERSREAFELWRDVHAVLAVVLLALVALHVAAALKHRFVDRDATLARMGLGRTPREDGTITRS
jgi:cytochrome b561